MLDKAIHHGVGMSSARSGLARRVLASSEAGSCTAQVKRARSSGVRAAHILSAEALSAKLFAIDCPEKKLTKINAR